MKYLKSLFINILVLSFACTPVLAGQTHYGGVLPAHSVDFRQGTAATRGFPGTPTTTLDRNDGQEYNYDGASLELLVDNEVRIHSTNGAGFEPAVANLLPFKDFDTNWSVSSSTFYQFGGSTYFEVACGGTGASTNTLDSDSIRSAASVRAVKIVIDNAGAVASDVAFKTNNTNQALYFTNGTDYTLSFYVKTNTPITGLTLIGTGGLSITFNTTTGYTKVETTWTSGATATNGQLLWYLGNKGLFDFYIDAISFEEASFASSRWIGEDAAVGADEVADGVFEATSKGANSVTGTDSDMSGANNWVQDIGALTFDINGTVAGKMFCDFTTGNQNVFLPTTVTIGKTYYVTLKTRLNAGTAVPIQVGGFATIFDWQSFEFTPTGTEATYTGYFKAD